MKNYVILRDLAAAGTGEPGIRPRGPSLQPFTESAPVVESAELTRGEVHDTARDPTVRAIAPTMPIRLIEPFASDIGPEAEAAGDAWGIAAVKADTSPFDGNGVTVAVLDTGIDKNHPAFAGVQLVERDFSGDGNGDKQGHGTHCAGTIFGRNVGGKRIGVARGVKRALIGKVLGDNGGGGSEMLFDGIQWASREGANVISMSLGFDFPGFVEQSVQQGMNARAATSSALEAYRANLRMFDTLMELIANSTAFNKGCVVVAATGNESERPAFEIAVSMPAAADGIVAVGAVGKGTTHAIAPFSNTFPQLVGPGVDVLSARAGGQQLVSLSGTSMATPHVAGLAALWWQARSGVANNASAAAVKAMLIATARANVFPGGQDPSCTGFGMATAPQA